MSNPYEIKQLKEECAAILSDQQKLFSKAKEENRVINADERQIYDASEADYQAKTDKIEHLERELKLAAVREDTVEQDRTFKVHKPVKEVSKAEANRAFAGWLTKGTEMYDPSFGHAARACGLDCNDSIRLFGTSAEAVGGLAEDLVPITLSQQLDIALRPVGSMRGLCTVFGTPSGEDYNIPTINDTATKSAATAESGDITVADFDVDLITFKAFKYTTAVVLTAEMIQDSSQDMFGLVAGLLAERHTDKVESLYCLGAGTTEPTGIAVAATTGVTTAHYAAMTLAECYDWLYSVPAQYRNHPSCAFVVHDLLAKELRKITGSVGQPLWETTLTAGQPDRFLGFPIYINNHLEAPGASKKSGVFGKMANYRIRDVGTPTLIRDDSILRLKDQIVLLYKGRHDAQLVESTGIGSVRSAIMASGS